MKNLVIVAQVVETFGTPVSMVTIRSHDGIYKAVVLESTGLEPVAGDGVIAQLIPASSEYFIVAITS
jgi:hypothetical protein